MPPERSEDAWIRAVAARFPASSRVKAGIGHDAAVVAFDGRDVVLKTDTVVDGVDFVLADCGPEAAGRKALCVAVSDLAAVGALPRAAVVSVVLPRGASFETYDGLARGLAAAAAETGCEVVGGDTSAADGPLVVAVAVVGEPHPRGAALRSGGRPGDALSVTGPLGGSILGRHLSFRPRLRESRALMDLGVPHAMMDVSDGLLADLPRLCAMSSCGADVVAEDVPVHEDVARLPPDGKTALEHALGDGEDFELLVAHAPLEAAGQAALASAGVTLHRIGTLTAARGALRLVVSGQRRPWPKGGWDHLRGR